MALNGETTVSTLYKYKIYIKNILKKYIYCIFVVLSGVSNATEICEPHRYADGDTFTFSRGGENVRVRVAGFDAPERGQPVSRQATARLRALTEGGARCDCYKQDRYGRSVCTVRTLARENVATLMLGAGLGCIDPRFEAEAQQVDRIAGRAALKDAKEQRRGMWGEPDALCAYDFRRLKNAK